ncbi:unnamed protein product [Rotaria magnacalcarata]|uniref:Uncharacterized protein n=1 Tax=Rotaria magnacalcarata TaxID=392030 RepID=A0A818ZUK5_9BILA|nr:unnamed protein product [Rotaria magnacalcarata]
MLTDSPRFSRLNIFARAKLSLDIPENANEHSTIVGEYKSACITSHYGLLGLNKVISIEGAPFGITSNIICPGNIKTLADLILFLPSDQARSITGQSIPWCLT